MLICDFEQSLSNGLRDGRKAYTEITVNPQMNIMFVNCESHQFPSQNNLLSSNIYFEKT